LPGVRYQVLYFELQPIDDELALIFESNVSNTICRSYNKVLLLIAVSGDSRLDFLTGIEELQIVGTNKFRLQIGIATYLCWPKYQGAFSFKLVG
jgi:hypothetical protein